jgi:hypothetical protein
MPLARAEVEGDLAQVQAFVEQTEGHCRMPFVLELRAELAARRR